MGAQERTSRAQVISAADSMQDILKTMKDQGESIDRALADHSKFVNDRMSTLEKDNDNLYAGLKSAAMAVHAMGRLILEGSLLDRLLWLVTGRLPQ